MSVLAKYPFDICMLKFDILHTVLHNEIWHCNAFTKLHWLSLCYYRGNEPADSRWVRFQLYSYTELVPIGMKYSNCDSVYSCHCCMIQVRARESSNLNRALFLFSDLPRWVRLRGGHACCWRDPRSGEGTSRVWREKRRWIRTIMRTSIMHKNKQHTHTSSR